MCGIPCETAHPLDGISVAAAICGEENQWEDRYILNLWKEQVSIRSQQYRLGKDGGLFDIAADRGQTRDLSKELPGIREEMMKAADDFRRQIAEELPEQDDRPFFLGHPGLRYTQIPARDGRAHGNIVRSNRWPNCSFFTNWTSLEDSITWQVRVPEDGRFLVSLYYSCPEGDEGSLIRLSVGQSVLQAEISEAHDPPLVGMEEDLAPRVESYVKDWKVAQIGSMELHEGEARMCLKAMEMPGNSVIDFRLFLFERLE
jgi:hypothetical protein